MTDKKLAEPASGGKLPVRLHYAVGKTGTGLTYRGYDISDLAGHAQFEEVAYLLLRGKLPTSQELEDYKKKLVSLRTLPEALKAVLECIPANAHPMDVMRTGCSVLGNLEEETSFSQQDDKIDRMLALFPAIICYWYKFSHEGVKITTETGEDSIGGHFLHLLHGKAPSALLQKVMHASLILYAEHEFNASTFTARVCASLYRTFILVLQLPLALSAAHCTVALTRRLWSLLNDSAVLMRQSQA